MDSAYREGFWNAGGKGQYECAHGEHLDVRTVTVEIGLLLGRALFGASTLQEAFFTRLRLAELVGDCLAAAELDRNGNQLHLCRRTLNARRRLRQKLGRGAPSYEHRQEKRKSQMPPLPGDTKEPPSRTHTPSRLPGVWFLLFLLGFANGAIFHPPYPGGTVLFEIREELSSL